MTRKEFDTVSDTTDATKPMKACRASFSNSVFGGGRFASRKLYVPNHYMRSQCCIVGIVYSRAAYGVMADERRGCRGERAVPQCADSVRAHLEIRQMVMN